MLFILLKPSKKCPWYQGPKVHTKNQKLHFCVIFQYLYWYSPYVTAQDDHCKKIQKCNFSFWYSNLLAFGHFLFDLSKQNRCQMSKSNINNYVFQNSTPLQGFSAITISTTDEFRFLTAWCIQCSIYTSSLVWFMCTSFVFCNATSILFCLVHMDLHSAIKFFYENIMIESGTFWIILHENSWLSASSYMFTLEYSFCWFQFPRSIGLKIITNVSS